MFMNKKDKILFSIFILSIIVLTLSVLVKTASNAFGATGHASAEVVVHPEPVDIWKCDDEGNCVLIKSYQ